MQHEPLILRASKFRLPCYPRPKRGSLTTVAWCLRVGTGGLHLTHWPPSPRGGFATLDLSGSREHCLGSFKGYSFPGFGYSVVPLAGSVRGLAAAHDQTIGGYRLMACSSASTLKSKELRTKRRHHVNSCEGFQDAAWAGFRRTPARLAQNRGQSKDIRLHSSFDTNVRTLSGTSELGSHYNWPTGETKGFGPKGA